MQYCQVKNNVVVNGPVSLVVVATVVPELDKNPENSRLYGWFPTTVIEPTIPPDHKKGERVVTIGDTVTITWEVVPMSPKEIFTRDTRIWLESMEAISLTMPDFMEQHIRDDHNGVVVSHVLQILYNEKLALRANKPLEP